MSLARQAAGSFLWASAASVIARLLTVASTFLLTRHLAPPVQGEVNLAFVLVATAGMATSLGVGQFVAARPTAGKEAAFHGTVIVYVSGLVSCLGALAAAPLTARILCVPGMVVYVPGLALAHFVERMGWVPRSLLVRDMLFRTLAIRLFLGEVSFAATSVVLAAAGLGGHAIVFGNVARAAVGTIFLLLVTDLRAHLSPHPLSRRTFREILSFGLPVTFAQLFRFGATSWDNSVIGARFGEAAVGLYNQAYRLAELPAGSVGEQLNDVLVPTFARLHTPEARRRGFLRAAAHVSLLVVPMSVGLAAVATDLVGVFYPPAYGGVAPFLTTLAAMSVARAFSSLGGAYLQAIGRTAAAARSDLALVAGVLASTAGLSRWGAVPAATGVAAAFFAHAVIMVRALAPDGVTLRVAAGAAARPLAATVPMLVVVELVRAGLASLGMAQGITLAAEIAAGAIAYAGSAWVVANALCRDFVALVSDVARRRRDADGEPTRPT